MALPADGAALAGDRDLHRRRVRPRGGTEAARTRSGSRLGIHVAAGKGATSRKTPAEITAACERPGRDPQPLVYASRISANVDNSAVQDGYQLYHHAFVFTDEGSWCIVQQGMSDEISMARRYHGLFDSVQSYVNEPHAAVCCDATAETLNLVASGCSPAKNRRWCCWRCRATTP